MTVTVPQTKASLEAGRKLWTSIEPKHPKGILSFWEIYAIRSLEERLPSLGLVGEEVEDPADLNLEGELTGIRLTEVAPNSAFEIAGARAGDILLEVGGEPFFSGLGLEHLHSWLMRELRAKPRLYKLLVWRDGKPMELEADLALGPYREPSTSN